METLEMFYGFISKIRDSHEGLYFKFDDDQIKMILNGFDINYRDYRKILSTNFCLYLNMFRMVNKNHLSFLLKNCIIEINCNEVQRDEINESNKEKKNRKMFYQNIQLRCSCNGDFFGEIVDKKCIYIFLCTSTTEKYKNEIRLRFDYFLDCLKDFKRPPIDLNDPYLTKDNTKKYSYFIDNFRDNFNPDIPMCVKDKNITFKHIKSLLSTFGICAKTYFIKVEDYEKILEKIWNMRVFDVFQMNILGNYINFNHICGKIKTKPYTKSKCLARCFCLDNFNVNEYDVIDGVHVLKNQRLDDFILMCKKTSKVIYNFYDLQKLEFVNWFKSEFFICETNVQKEKISYLNRKSNEELKPIIVNWGYESNLFFESFSQFIKIKSINVESLKTNSSEIKMPTFISTEFLNMLDSIVKIKGIKISDCLNTMCYGENWGCVGKVSEFKIIKLLSSIQNGSINIDTPAELGFIMFNFNSIHKKFCEQSVVNERIRRNQTISDMELRIFEKIINLPSIIHNQKIEEEKNRYYEAVNKCTEIEILGSETELNFIKNEYEYIQMEYFIKNKIKFCLIYKNFKSPKGIYNLNIDFPKFVHGCIEKTGGMDKFYLKSYYVYDKIFFLDKHSLHASLIKFFTFYNIKSICDEIMENNKKRYIQPSLASLGFFKKENIENKKINSSNNNDKNDFLQEEEEQHTSHKNDKKPFNELLSEMKDFLKIKKENKTMDLHGWGLGMYMYNNKLMLVDLADIVMNGDNEITIQNVDGINIHDKKFHDDCECPQNIENLKLNTRNNFNINIVESDYMKKNFLGSKRIFN